MDRAAASGYRGAGSKTPAPRRAVAAPAGNIGIALRRLGADTEYPALSRIVPASAGRFGDCAQSS